MDITHSNVNSVIVNIHGYTAYSQEIDCVTEKLFCVRACVYAYSVSTRRDHVCMLVVCRSQAHTNSTIPSHRQNVRSRK